MRRVRNRIRHEIVESLPKALGICIDGREVGIDLRTHVKAFESGGRDCICGERSDVEGLQPHRRDIRIGGDPSDPAAGCERQPDELPPLRAPDRAARQDLGDR